MRTQGHLTPGRLPVATTLSATMRVASRLLRLVGMLAMMLAIASTSKAVWAQDGDKIHSYLKVEGPKEICKDAVETISVMVISDQLYTARDLLGEENSGVMPVRQSGVEVTASVTGDSVKLQWSSLKTNTVLNEFSVEGVKTGSAKVTFKAPLKRRPNEQMDGEIGKDNVRNSIDLEVVECDFRVSVDARFQVPATAGPIRFVATYTTLLKSDGKGNYNGEEGKKVYWTASTLLPDKCTLDEDNIEGSKATVKAALKNKGQQLEVQITFNPTIFHVKGECTAGRGSEKIDNTYKLALKPLTVTVSKKVDSKPLQHKLTVAGMEITGLTYLSVRSERSGRRRP